ncbi:MAG: acyl-CoA dehydrogenase family protein [Thermodesulfobacteriota bacterium]|nr:acyl-CoA dehydrogenase family protein [Thermodesulfobacteriota bacterium]
MDFELTDEQKMLVETAGNFAKNEFAPVAQELDREEKYPMEIWEKASKLGLVGAWLPEEYGGAGVGFLGNALITEQFAEVDLGISLIVAATFGCEAIYWGGTEEQKKKYLPLVAQGSAISAGAFTEPDAGTDVAGARTRAVIDGNDYVINGNKMFITNADVCTFMVTLCVTNPDNEKRYKRYSLIIVESDRKGVTTTKIHGKMGIRASDTAEVSFEDVRVPRENLVGTSEGQGFYQAMQFFDTTRIMVAAQGAGLAQGALDKSIEYVKERKAFGAPIASFQITQQKLAEMAIRIEATRNLVYKSASYLDNGKVDPTLNAITKYYAGETAVFCANYAVELHGGYGYIDEYDVQRFYRDAKILQIYEGTKEAEVLTIARRLLT